MISHVTVIDDRAPTKAGGKIRYVACCLCGWKSDLLSSRPAAVRTARMHRASAAVQKL